MVATVQNIVAEQGARLVVTLSGAPGTLTGRNLVMHVRASYDDIATKLTASNSDGRLVVASASTATLDIGSDLMAAVRVDQPEEVWVYDVESYTTSTDGRREWSGSFTISRDATRDTAIGRARCGSVRNQNFCSALAPSMPAASIWSRSSDCSEVMKIRQANGSHCHATCSRGASVGVSVDGRRSAKQRSRLCVVLGG